MQRRNIARVDSRNGAAVCTGKEIFVGVSEATNRTNQSGAQCVARAFPEYPTTVVRLPGAKKLKDLICMSGPVILAVGQSEEARRTLKDMMNVASYGYKIISLADENFSSNVIYVNGSLMHLSHELIPRSFGVSHLATSLLLSPSPPPVFSNFSILNQHFAILFLLFSFYCIH